MLAWAYVRFCLKAESSFAKMLTSKAKLYIDIASRSVTIIAYASKCHSFHEVSLKGRYGDGQETGFCSGHYLGPFG